uniref:Uncharacterized protein n=1 Tax=Knipowitschia caucasica TaxID=637954 RepID=A0AAV2LVC0_KNICA
MATVTCTLGTVVLITLLLWTNARVLRNSVHELKQKLEFVSRDGDTTHVLTRHKHNGAFRKSGGQWPRSRDGNVYVPCVIDDGYSSVAKAAFMMGFVLFHLSTCIRLVSRTNETDFLHIQPSNGSGLLPEAWEPEGSVQCLC